MAQFCDEYVQYLRVLLFDWSVDHCDRSHLRDVVCMTPEKLQYSAEKIWPGIYYVWWNTIRVQTYTTLIRYLCSRGLNTEIGADSALACVSDLTDLTDSCDLSVSGSSAASVSSATSVCSADFECVVVDFVDSETSGDTIVFDTTSLAEMGDNGPPPETPGETLPGPMTSPGPETRELRAEPVPEPVYSSLSGYRETNRPESEASAYHGPFPRPTPAQAAYAQYMPAFGAAQEYGPIPSAPMMQPPMQPPFLPRQIVYHQQPMPDPGTPGAPFFDGKNVSEFVRTYEGMCKRRGISDPGSMCDGLADYCDFTVRMWIESSPSWRSRDFETLKREIRSRYQDQDREYARYSRTSLHELMAQRHETYDEIRQYLTQFAAISDVLLQRQAVGELQRCEWLLQGLPLWLSSKVIKRGHISFENPSGSRPIMLHWVIELVYQILDTKREFEMTIQGVHPARFISQEGQGTQVSKEKHAHWSKEPDFSAEKRLGQHDGQPSQGTRVDSSSDFARALDQLNRKFDQMDIKVNTMQTGLAKQDSRRNPRWEPTDRERSGGDITCYFCGGERHIARPYSCRELSAYLKEERVHYEEDGSLYLGRLGDGGPRIRNRRGTPTRDLIPEQLAAWRASSAPVSYIQTRLDSEGHRADDHTSRPVYDDHGVQRAQINYLGMRLGSCPDQNLEIDDPSDEEVVGYEQAGLNAVGTRNSQDSARKRRREQGIASTRNPQTGRYEQPRVTDLDDEEVMAEGPSQLSYTQLDMSTPSSRQVSLEPSMGSQIRPAQGSSKSSKTPPFASMDTALENDIKKRFLDMEVSIKLSEMAKIAPKFRNILFREDAPSETRAMSSNALVPYQSPNPIPLSSVNTTHARIVTDLRRSIPVRGVSDDDGLYSLPLLYTDVRIEQFVLRGMLDSGSGLNVIGRKQAKELSHPIRRDPRISVVPVNGVDIKCLGCLQDVPVSIGDLTIRINIFVLPVSPGLILGRPFMEATLLTMEHRSNGSVRCTVYNESRTRRLEFSATVPKEGRVVGSSSIWPDEPQMRRLDAQDEDGYLEDHNDLMKTPLN
ncbi:hypothetical protein N7486_005106 [Penicillium sp. IBT 16267x]|nr:hypothetical protein N7486_005106 [Penicillium sp. IBT 16267x]